MGFSYNLTKKNEYNEVFINYSANIPESFSDKLYNSIVKIFNNDNITTGFFMKLKIDKNALFFLITCNHVISQQFIDQNSPLYISYGKKNEEKKQKIILDKSKRLIINYTSPIDIIIIQIIGEDNISKDKFLMADYNYLNGFETYGNKDFCTAGYPDSIKNERCISFGKILNINNYNSYEFEHSLDEKYCSSGSPICLIQNQCIIGIHKNIDKNKNIKYGTFIGIIFNQLEQEYKQQIKTPYKNNYLNPKEEKTMTKEVIKKDIEILDYILKKDCSPNEDYFNFFNILKSKRNGHFLINASIFDKPIYADKRQEFLNKLNYNHFNDLEKAFIGSILGMAIGDAIGSRVEFQPLDYVNKEIKDMGISPAGNFNLEPGQWTENTSMGLCIADSLIEKKTEFDPRDIMMRFILWWQYGYNNTFRFDTKRANKNSVGLSGITKKSLVDYINRKGMNIYTKIGDHNSSGNGSLIRNVAIPLCYFRNLDKALDFAKKQSLITHQGDEAAGCCQLLTYIIIQILNLKNKNDLNAQTFIKKSSLSFHNNQEDLKTILDNLKNFKGSKYVQCLLSPDKNDKNKEWNWKSDCFKYNEVRAQNMPNIIGSYCMDGFAMALHALYITNNFKDCILKVANLCGDSGAVSSIVGQIAGAYYGLDSIPKDWIKTINRWDNNEIALRGYILCHLNEKNIFI